MSEGNAPQMPQPDPALNSLDRLVGTWSIEGNLVGSDEKTIKGQTTFRWLPARFFVEERFSLHFLGMAASGSTDPARAHVNPR